MRVLLIDNYDSFTYNLVHQIGELGADTTVVRNDKISLDEIAAFAPEAIILSPGPKTPNEAGICIPLVERFSGEIPIFGVCLGLQTIGQVFGGDVVRAPTPMHGRVSKVTHNGTGIFKGINKTIDCTRYHSLVVDANNVPDDLNVTAKSDDGQIMAVAHKTMPVHAVQFHPESIYSESGHVILQNFLNIARAFNAEKATKGTK